MAPASASSLVFTIPLGFLGFQRIFLDLPHCLRACPVWDCGPWGVRWRPRDGQLKNSRGTASQVRAGSAWAAKSCRKQHLGRGPQTAASIKERELLRLQLDDIVASGWLIDHIMIDNIDKPFGAGGAVGGGGGGGGGVADAAEWDI